MVERKGVGGGCHGDSNTPVALPTCLPGPNLLREGGEEGTVGGREGGRVAQGAETFGRGRGREGEETREEGGKLARKQETDQTRKKLPVVYTYCLS